MNIEQEVFIVDDDADVRDTLCLLLKAVGFEVSCFASAQEFLAGPVSAGGCLIADMQMPGMSGLELQEEIARAGLQLPVILVTGHGDVPLAVRAMKAGAIDFIEKPFDGEALLNSVRRALKIGQQLRCRDEEAKAARAALAALTARERDVLDHLVLGQPNKVVAFKLGISSRTVEIHRARIMRKTRSRSLSDLVRLALAAAATQGNAYREAAVSPSVQPPPSAL